MSSNLSDTEKKIFKAIEDNDAAILKTALSEKPDVNILDENSMTPLQFAAYKGKKDLVQMLLDYGADPNLCKHQHNYTALHFAGLSGNLDVCVALLSAGARTDAINTVNRTAAQMAAFVGHHNCVAAMNNYIPKSEICYYSTTKQRDGSPYLPQFLLESFHKLLLQINIHPVRVAINLWNLVGLQDHLGEVKQVLQLMSEKEMKKGPQNNEVMAFKFHYLSYIAGEMIKIQKQTVDSQNKDKKVEFVDIFTRGILKSSEILDGFIKDAIRDFPFHDSTLFRQMVATLASKDPPSALSVVSAAINGQRGFIDNVPICSTCGEEKPAKKCAKCKMAQYCDRNCQKWHWHWHKKVCGTIEPEGVPVEAPDVGELTSEVQNLLVQN